MVVAFSSLRITVHTLLILLLLLYENFTRLFTYKHSGLFQLAETLAKQGVTSC